MRLVQLPDLRAPLAYQHQFGHTCDRAPALQDEVDAMFIEHRFPDGLQSRVVTVLTAPNLYDRTPDTAEESEARRQPAAEITSVPSCTFGRTRTCHDGPCNGDD